MLLGNIFTSMATASGSNPPKRWPCRVGAALEIGPVRLRNLNHSGARASAFTPLRDTLAARPTSTRPIIYLSTLSSKYIPAYT